MIALDPSARALELGAAASFAVAAFATTHASFARSDAPGSRALERYLALLRADMRALFLRIDVRPIVVLQAIGAYLSVAFALGMHDATSLVALPVVAVLPRRILAHLRAKRVAAIELQTDTFVMALTSALKATPSIGDAFQSLVTVLAEPLRSEIDFATKQVRLGSTLEEALLDMARRVESRAFDTAIAAVLIGRRLGGDLPAALAATGAGIRELHRLDRMSRAKTASGRIQLGVIAFAPATLTFVMDAISPGFFRPLTTTSWGIAALATSIALWAVALLLGRRILAVTI